MKKQIAVILIVIFTVVLSGCVREEQTVVVPNRTDGINISNVYHTEITNEEGVTVVVGRIVEIRYRSEAHDVLVFQDGTLIQANVGSHIFKIGEVYTIKMYPSFNGMGYDIHSVSVR